MSFLFDHGGVRNLKFCVWTLICVETEPSLLERFRDRNLERLGSLAPVRVYSSNKRNKVLLSQQVLFQSHRAKKSHHFHGLSQPAQLLQPLYTTFHNNHMLHLVYPLFQPLQRIFFFNRNLFH